MQDFQPPTLVLVCNQPKAFSSQYRRYLLSVFRDQLDFGEVPIKLYLQKRSESDRRDELDGGARSAKGARFEESQIQDAQIDDAHFDDDPIDDDQFDEDQIDGAEVEEASDDE